MNLNKMWVIGFIIIVSFFSCERYIGYGVIMLPGEESSLEAGSLIKITKESRIRETWVYNTPEEEHLEIKKWRVEYYNELTDAQNYIEKHNNYKDYFVIVNKNSHSMRVRPVKTANLVYRLKKGQKIKVLGRTEEKEKIASFNGYWWELITEDGVKGWSYDSYLSVYNGNDLIHTNVSQDGPEIHDFFSSIWRPKYFRTMEKSRNVDLERFKLKFKLVPDLDNKEITISMPNHYATYKFTEFKKTGKNNYNLIGSPIQLDFSMNGAVTVIYSVDSKSYETNFVNMKDSVVAEIINSEKTTRRIKFNEFLFEGPTYKSKVYGEIKFSDSNKFIWKNKKNLIAKQLITGNAKNEGTVSFKIFLGRNIINMYDGIITFDFGARQELSFFYTFEDSGIKFLYIPPGKIQGNVVQSNDFYTPVQLFFTGGM